MNNLTCVFKVKVADDKRVYRIIEMRATDTLDDLHDEILESYEFDDDHLYSFFMDNKAWSNNEYCSPRANGRRANKIKLEQLDLSPKQKFLYLYDYGDNWEFEVEFVENGVVESNKKYPRILKSSGESPEQY